MTSSAMQPLTGQEAEPAVLTSAAWISAIYLVIYSAIFLAAGVEAAAGAPVP